jgi:hypothetical protein
MKVRDLIIKLQEFSEDLPVEILLCEDEEETIAISSISYYTGVDSEGGPKLVLLSNEDESPKEIEEEEFRCPSCNHLITKCEKCGEEF